MATCTQMIPLAPPLREPQGEPVRRPLTPEEKRVTAQRWCEERQNGTLNTVALAAVQCTTCAGRGYEVSPEWACRPCKCVFRAVFRVCIGRYRRSRDVEGPRISAQMLDPSALQGNRRLVYSFRESEFVADFELIAKRTLDAAHWKVFRLHMVEGLEWKECCERLLTDKGKFFHSVYRVQEKLGRAFLETRPYPLYPIDEYFRGRMHCSPQVRIEV